MTTVITGASGHIGAALTRAFNQENQPIRVLVHQEDEALKGVSAQLLHGDVLDFASLKSAFDGAQTVFHLAAVISISGDPDGRLTKVNVGGTKNVIQACLECKVKRLVHFSSIHALNGYPPDIPVDENRAPATGPKAYPYDRSKALAEQAVLEAVANRGLDAVIVNPTGVIGPYDFKLSQMGRLLLDLAEGRLFALVDGGFDWVDVRDVANAAMALAQKGRSGERYLLPGHYLHLRALAKLVEDHTGVPAPRMVFPMWAARLVAPFALYYARLFKQDPLFTPESLGALRGNHQILGQKAADEIGYTPRLIDQTIKDTLDWFSEAGLL